MSNTHGTRRFFGRTMAIGPIAAAIVFAAQPSTGYAADDVFATIKESGSITTGSPIVELVVPPGKYAFLAKINLDQDTKTFVTVVCGLMVPDVVLDRNVIRLQPSNVKYVDNLTMPFQGVLEVQENQHVFLFCTSPPGNVLSFRFARITAIRVDGILCEQQSPAACPDLHPVP
jgi:hypothetical protein